MRTLTYVTGALVGAALLTGCDDNRQLTTAPGGARTAPTPGIVAAEDQTGLKDKGDVKIVTATGDIAPAVEQFRRLLGDLNQNIKGDDQLGNRREINWDGVPSGPDGVTDNDNFPGDFFNVKSPRGVLFTTDGPAFRISSNGYTDVNPDYAGEFNFFSPKKLFVARGSTITDVQFVVAGSNIPATVTGFGSVFCDVGRAHSTTIEYFDVDGNRLLTVVAPRASDDRGLSFAGANFDSRIVARVRITSGDTPIGADVTDNVKGAGQKRDIVAMDDFIYGEPRKIN
jgi:hypothetical protein